MKSDICRPNWLLLNVANDKISCGLAGNFTGRDIYSMAQQSGELNTSSGTLKAYKKSLRETRAHTRLTRTEKYLREAHKN